MSATAPHDVLKSLDMGLVREMVRLAYCEAPGMLLGFVEDELRRSIKDRWWLAASCLQVSVLLFVTAMLTFWWLALASLPLSLAGTHYARQARALRRRWHAPVVNELGATWALSAPLARGGA